MENALFAVMIGPKNYGKNTMENHELASLKDPVLAIQVLRCAGAGDRARTRDLGDGFEVRRALPHGKRADGRALIFRSFRTGAVHVRQGHGRAPASTYRARTVTYLFDGSNHAP